MTETKKTPNKTNNTQAGKTSPASKTNNKHSREFFLKSASLYSLSKNATFKEYELKAAQHKNNWKPISFDKHNVSNNQLEFKQN